MCACVCVRVYVCVRMCVSMCACGDEHLCLRLFLAAAVPAVEAASGHLPAAIFVFLTCNSHFTAVARQRITDLKT